MTNKDAVMMLRLFCGLDPEDKTSVSQAFKMAIKALEQPEIIRCGDCHYYDDEHCYMHNTGVYPDDYCSYAVRR